MIGGKKYNGLQVDIWSCGVILFAIVCGYLPFEVYATTILLNRIGPEYSIIVQEDLRRRLCYTCLCLGRRKRLNHKDPNS